MSYRRTCVIATAGGASAMTVRTNHVALSHLVEHALPVAVAEPLRDAEQLVALMVELEHHGI
jgi:hypothetical protein